MLNRKIEKDIDKWIEADGKALLVTGVRQSGKTFIIRECLKRAGCDYIEFNLIYQPQIIKILSESFSVDDLVTKLSLYADHRFIPGETVIFFDEIQKCKDVVTKIKFWVDDGRFKYVLSGSLLGIELYNLRSAPVGYLKTLTMYPLDFEEFLQVFNISDSVIDMLENCFKNRLPVDEVVHERLIEIFRIYLIIGGMPAAVEQYRTGKGDINAVIDEHMSIIEQYKQDFTQYEAEDKKLILTRIYEMIPAEINEKNKRFMIADIEKNLRYDRIQDSFIWLWKAGVALPVFNVTEPAVPLMLNEKSSLFKLFLSDVGLLTTIYGKAVKLRILNNEADINKGSIYENIIAQELNAHGYSLRYYNSKKMGELDFVVEHCGEILPIEVKSGKSYERHSALNQIMSVEEYGIREACVFSNANVMVKGKVVYLPVYMIMFLKGDDVELGNISVEKFLL